MAQTNRERLEEGGVLARGQQLTPEAEAAIENLTAEQVEQLIATRRAQSEQLKDEIETFTGVSPIQLHHIV